MKDKKELNFIELIREGDLVKLNLFVSKLPPEEVQHLIGYREYKSLYLAVILGHIHVLSWLQEKAPSITQTPEFTSSFFTAITTGNFAIINQLLTMAPEKILTLIRKDNYCAFRFAAAMNHQDTVKGLLQRAPLYSVEMLNALALEDRTKAYDLMMEPDIRALVISPIEDLRKIASFSESSMRALSPMEISMSNKLLLHYQADIDDLGGSTKVIETLRADLIRRYQEHPATVTNDKGQAITLPIDFNEFQKLGLHGQTYAKALQCYYQHPIHTALRYLSKPNLWINPEAEHVFRDSSGASSSFEHHTKLIGLMYLAARDEKTPGIDGFSVEDRLNMFFKELSLIARAHNWDGYRNNPVTCEEEQYDDLTADKPSCPGGVNKRLLQAVHGHPLTKLLTEDLITQEILDFVKTQFLDNITKDNVHELRQAWDDIISTGGTSSKVLECLNISGACQRKFLEDMSDKYGYKLSIPHIKFLLSQFETNSIFPNHAARFGGELDLDAMIDKKIAFFASQTGSHGFFSPDKEVEPPPSQPKPD